MYFVVSLICGICFIFKEDLFRWMSSSVLWIRRRPSEETIFFPSKSCFYKLCLRLNFVLSHGHTTHPLPLSPSPHPPLSSRQRSVSLRNDFLWFSWEVISGSIHLSSTIRSRFIFLLLCCLCIALFFYIHYFFFSFTFSILLFSVRYFWEWEETHCIPPHPPYPISLSVFLHWSNSIELFV